MAISKASSKKKSKDGVIVRAARSIRRRPWIAVFVGVIIIVLLVGLVPRVQETFAAGCSGRKIGTHSIRRPRDNKYAGYVEVYYSSSKGKNCAIAYAGGVTSGKKLLREICIGVSGQKKSCDEGKYISYAGPRWTPTSSKGKCIDIFASTYKLSGGAAEGWVLKKKIHCG